MFRQLVVHGCQSVEKCLGACILLHVLQNQYNSACHIQKLSQEAHLMVILRRILLMYQLLDAFWEIRIL